MLVTTTNTIEGYNRQLRKVIKNKASFPTVQSVRKLLYLANIHITKKWTRPIPNSSSRFGALDTSWIENRR